MGTDQNQSKREWLLEALDCYEGRLIQYSARIIGSVDVARDVVQETFLQLWKVKRSKVEHYLEQWLYTVCRNRSLDVLKKDKRLVALQSDTDYYTAEVASPVEEIEVQETQGRLFATIQSLPANQREVIFLKFKDDLSYKEISKITGLSVSNVGFLIHSGLKTARSLLKGRGMYEKNREKR